MISPQRVYPLVNSNNPQNNLQNYYVLIMLHDL